MKKLVKTGLSILAVLILFFALSRIDFDALLVSLLMGKNSAGENPANFTKDRAAASAMVKLVRYAEAHHVPVYKFRGPYFMESIGGDFPTYRICFKSPTLYYCYDQWTGIEDSGSYPPASQKSERLQWLESQSD